MVAATGEYVDAVKARFMRFPLKDDAISSIERITGEFEDFAEWLAGVLPVSREGSLALTHLQEAKFWANDAIAHDVDSEQR